MDKEELLRRQRYAESRRAEQGIPQVYAQKLLDSGMDIARDFRGISGFPGEKSSKSQQQTYSTQNIQGTRDMDIPLSTELLSGSGITLGNPNPKDGPNPLYEMYRDMPLSAFADQYFNNLPAVILRDDEGRPFYFPDDSDEPSMVPLGLKVRSGGVEGTNLQLLMGEMLALDQKARDLDQKAREGRASQRELELLDAYQQFMASRTGM